MIKIAVTYDNGSVFQHFGRTENFKVYTVEDGAVVSAEIFSSNGTGHEALAGLLAENGIDVIICGGCGGGCGGAAPQIEGKNVGKTCKVHYTSTFNDGTKFDSSYDRGEPLEFTCGIGMMIPGFDKAVAVMEVGETVNIHLMPEEAYGMPDPRAFITAPIAQLPGSETLNVGERVYLYNQMGQPMPVVVAAKDDVNITFDANHEMAGKELNFLIELVSAE